MQIQVGAPGNAPVGGSIQLTAILPGSTFSGTLQYSISLTDGTGVQNLGARHRGHHQHSVRQT